MTDRPIIRFLTNPLTNTLETMKKALLLLFVFATLFSFRSTAQICVRDSNLLVTGDLLSPAPYAPDSPFYNLKPACIQEMYDQSVTIFVPDSFDYQGIIKIKINNVSIATSNAIGNYPAGLTYSCDPPNCVFNPLTLGCIRLYGTPTTANMADTFDLKIEASVSTIIGPQKINFPGDAAPGNHYYLILRNMGECVSGTDDPGSPFSAVQAVPNPLNDHTRIDVRSTQNGRFQFEVFDLLGHRVHAQAVELFEGENQFDFDASALPAGTYLYTVGNSDGKSIRRMVKQ